MSEPELHFAAAQEPQAEEYRPLSGLAVTAALLGLLSPLGIAAPFLLVIPVGGILFALAALARIRSSAGELSGRRLALFGLALAVFFGVWATTQDLGRRWVLAWQARQFCDGWLQLMQDGKVCEAHQWVRAPEDRFGATADYRLIYEQTESAREELNSFLATLPFDATMDGSSLRSFRYVGNDNITYADMLNEYVIVHRYEVVAEKDGKPRTDLILLTVRRMASNNDNFVHWQLRQVQRAADRPGNL